MATYVYNYPRPAVAVDIAVFTIQADGLKILLIQRGHPPFQGNWALPGGFVEMDEALDEAARRELEEETGVANPMLMQLHTYGDPNRDPRGRILSVAYVAVIPPEAKVRFKGGDDASRAKWFPVNALPPLAFDHPQITADALQWLKTSIFDSAIACKTLPDTFPLAKIQKIYGLITGEDYAMGELKKRLVDSGVLEPTQEKDKENRPTYRYSTEAFSKFKKKDRYSE